MKYLDGPLLVFTADVDWASECCIEQLIERFRQTQHKPIFFATHESPALRHALARGVIDIGLHPNFLPNSSHGDTVDEVFDHLTGAWPEARLFRSHSFMDGSRISLGATARGLQADSNIVQFLQPGIAPWRHWTGLWKFPVFWEDDIHWHVQSSWDWKPFEAAFATPGLKIINVHPFVQAFNVPSQDRYVELAGLTTVCDSENIAAAIEPGSGSSTFLDAIFEWAERRRIPSIALSDLADCLGAE